MARPTRREALALASAAAIMPPAHGATMAAPWTGGGTIRVGGGVINYASVGEGRPTVLLPKLGGWIADWSRLAPLIASGRRLVAIDPPGHGGSHMDGLAPEVMTVPECAAMVLAAIDQLDLGRCDWVGNSLGGVIALLVAATYPERVRRLALISTALGEPTSRQAIAQQDRERAASGDRLTRSAAEQTARFGTVDPTISAEQAASNAQAGEWKRACERGVARLGAADYLSRILAPTLLISADRGAYLRYNAIARARLPGVRVETVRNSGSFVHQEKPADAALLLRPFLDEG